MAKLLVAISLLVGAGACSSPAPTANRSTTTTGPTTTLAPTTTEAPTTTTEPEPATTTTSEAVETVEEAPTTVPTTRARSAPTTVPYEPASPPSRTTGGDAPLDCIRRYEQGAAGYATDTGNGFYGAFQFDLETWASVGGTGNPAHASPAEQDMRARMLYDRRGLAPWPTPAVMCR